MDLVLSFFSDLILFTAGLAVLAIWACIIVGIGIEIYDAFHENPDEDDEED